MKSTGEVMGVGKTFGEAFVKSQMGAGVKLPTEGKIFLSVKNADKVRAVVVAKELVAMGYAVRHAWHGCCAGSCRPERASRQQGDRRPPSCGGHDQEW